LPETASLVRGYRKQLAIHVNLKAVNSCLLKAAFLIFKNFAKLKIVKTKLGAVAIDNNRN